MPASTMYVIQPFDVTEDGAFAAAQPEQAQSEGQAVRRAHVVAKQHAGVIAFARTGDAAIGEYEPAKILLQLGTVPDELE